MDEVQFRSLVNTLAFDRTRNARDTQGASLIPQSALKEPLSTVAAHAQTEEASEFAKDTLEEPRAPRLVSHDGTSTSPEFALGKTIGEGGMGIVRLATQHGLRRDVAIKTLKSNNQDNDERRGLLHEALVTGGLEHPNIVPIYTLSELADSGPAIVMKRIEGVSWLRCIKDPTLAPGSDGHDILGWHLEVLSQVCLAVHFAHSKGIIHRDIKPENVMLGSYGEVYLVDWGIAVTTDPDKSAYLLHATNANGVAGSPAYMAPEMTTGTGSDLGPFTDIYLLGATLSEILTGHPPHRGDALVEVLYAAYRSEPVTCEDAPPELLKACHRAMHKNPEARFESAEALRRALHDYSTHRASATLANEAHTRLETLATLIETGAASDALVRERAGEVRFALEQSRKIWPDNTDATDTYQRWLVLMASWELKARNLAAAEHLFVELTEVPASLAAELSSVKRAEAGREADIARLEALGEDLDQGHGARSRYWAAAIAVLVWTILPLTAGIGTGWGANPLSQDQYLSRSVLVPLFIAAYWVVLLRRGTINKATRSIMQNLAVFALLIPLFRFVITRGDMTSVQALSIEDLVYGLLCATLAIQSGRSGLPGIVFFGSASIASTVWPNYTYAFLSAANCFSLTWLARIWASQVDQDSEQA